MDLDLRRQLVRRKREREDGTLYCPFVPTRPLRLASSVMIMMCIPVLLRLELRRKLRCEFSTREQRGRVARLGLSSCSPRYGKPTSSFQNLRQQACTRLAFSASRRWHRRCGSISAVGERSALHLWSHNNASAQDQRPQGRLYASIWTR